MSQVLEEPALVLNRGWVPVQVTCIRQAIVLGFGGRARFVDARDFQTHDFLSWMARPVPEDRRSVHGVAFTMEAPEVIVLDAYAKRPPLTVVFNRRNLHRRDGGACQYCGKTLTLEEMTIDHVCPISRGGLTDWDNCVVACRRCNGRKADRLPHEADLKTPRGPSRPGWSPLFSAMGRRPRPKSWEPFLRAAKTA